MGEEGLQKRQLGTSVALAEFTALRSEIGTRMTTQMTLVGAGLTALGVIVGFAIPKTAAKDGSHESLLLLAIPALAAAVNTLWAVENRQIGVIGVYIRDRLWPLLGDLAGCGQDLPSWEQYVSKHRVGRGNVLRSLATDYVSTLIFGASAIAALWLVQAPAFRSNRTPLWGIDVALTVIAVLVPFGMTRGGLKRAQPGRPPSAP